MALIVAMLLTILVIPVNVFAVEGIMDDDEYVDIEFGKEYNL